jgi:hypothetical protein
VLVFTAKYVVKLAISQHSLRLMQSFQWRRQFMFTNQVKQTSFTADMDAHVAQTLNL